jgi:glutaredoxin-like protein NrdH
MPQASHGEPGFAFEMVNVDQQPDAADTLREQGFASCRW